MYLHVYIHIPLYPWNPVSSISMYALYPLYPQHLFSFCKIYDVSKAIIAGKQPFNGFRSDSYIHIHTLEIPRTYFIFALHKYTNLCNIWLYKLWKLKGSAANKSQVASTSHIHVLEFFWVCFMMLMLLIFFFIVCAIRFNSLGMIELISSTSRTISDFFFFTGPFYIFKNFYAVNISFLQANFYLFDRPISYLLFCRPQHCK